MSKTGYQQFFSKASEVRRDSGEADVKDRVQFRSRPKQKPAAQQAKPRVQTEERLRQMIKVKPAKRRAPFPLKAAAGMVVTMVAVTGYLLFPDQVEKFYGKIEFSAFGEARAASEKPAPSSADSAKSAADPKAKAAGGPETKTTAKGAEADAPVPEELKKYESLKQRKEELDAREKDLNGLEEELQKQKVELTKRIAQLEEMRGQIGKMLKDRVEVDQEKVNKLVDLYSNMKPKQAADILANLNEELAVEVLAKMKKKNAAEIMNLLTPAKAQVLSEKYTGYRRNVSSTEPNKG